jgi:hypothetical protein
MSLILAIEPDRRQAAKIAALAKSPLHAELVVAESTAKAFATLANRTPDLILTSLLLSPKDETALADRLRELDAAGTHVQMLVIPVLGAPGRRGRKDAGGGLLKRLRGSKSQDTSPDGCDPAVFAAQIAEYLERAAAERRAAAVALEDEMASQQDPVYATRREAKTLGPPKTRRGEPARPAIFASVPTPEENWEEIAIEISARVSDHGDQHDSTAVVSTESIDLEAFVEELNGSNESKAVLSMNERAAQAEAAAAAAAREAAHREAAAREAAAKEAAARDAAAREMAAREAAARKAAEAAARETAAKEAAAREAAKREAEAREAAAREVAAKEAAARTAAEAAAREAAAKEAAAREAAKREAAAREAAAREAAAKAFAAREAARRESEAREAAAREAAKREQAAREAAAREAAKREAEAREAAAREAAKREAEAREAAARETAAKEAAAKEAAARKAAEREAAARKAAEREAAAREAAAEKAAAREAAIHEAAAKRAAAKEAIVREIAARAAAASANPSAADLDPVLAEFLHDGAVSAPSAKSTKARPASGSDIPAQPGWMHLLTAIKRDIEQLRTDRVEAVAPAAPTIASADEDESTGLNGANGTKARVPATAKKRKKAPVPVQDEWGFFDPQQCGFAALLAKLDEITDQEAEVPAKKPPARNR